MGAKIGFDAEENEPSKVRSFGRKIGIKFGIGSFNLGADAQLVEEGGQAERGERRPGARVLLRP